MTKSKHALIINCNLKKIITLCAFLSFFPQTIFSQLSVSAGYKSFFPKGWSDSFIRYRSSAPYPHYGWEAAIGYQVFRAKLYRIEFTPSFLYSQFDENVDIPIGFGNFKFTQLKHEQFAFQFNVSCYVFDFFGDITDPRHTAAVGFLKSHTFFEIAPIFVHYGNKTITKESTNDYSTILGIGNTLGGSIGLGVDLPLSSSYVLTLLTRFHYFPDYDRNGSPSSIKSDLRQVYIGCRFRFGSVNL